MLIEKKSSMSYVKLCKRIQTEERKRDLNTESAYANVAAAYGLPACYTVFSMTTLGVWFDLLAKGTTWPGSKAQLLLLDAWEESNQHQDSRDYNKGPGLANC